MTASTYKDASTRGVFTHALAHALRINGALLLVPASTPLFTTDSWLCAVHYITPAILCLVIGQVLIRKHPLIAEPNNRTGHIIITSVWALVMLVSSVPLITLEGAGIVQGVFESVSGWTTTGLSIFDVTRLSMASLLWRALMQLAGGAGLAILFVVWSTLPGGSVFSRVEGRVLLVPQVRRSAMIVLRIYASYLLVGTAAYMVAGLNSFDAFTHTCAAISTGGFSTKTASIGDWNSALVESISIVLMILGSMNFLTVWLAVTGEWKSFIRNSELRVMTVALVVTLPLLILGSSIPLYGETWKAVRVGIFEGVSALTTTGFSTVGYTDWNGLGIALMTVLMLIGGAACSTAGGIKQIRIAISFKLMWQSIRRYVAPQGTVNLTRVHDGRDYRALRVDDFVDVSAFIILYLTTFTVMSILIAAHGHSVAFSFFEAASALGTVGLSIGITGTTTPDSILVVEIIGMFLGRLEFFAVFVALSAAFRRRVRPDATRWLPHSQPTSTGPYIRSGTD